MDVDGRAYAGIIVQGGGGHREGLLRPQQFAEGRAAGPAEASNMANGGSGAYWRMSASPESSRKSPARTMTMAAKAPAVFRHREQWQ